MKIVQQTIKTMGELDSIKIYAANGIAFLSTFTTLDSLLKIVLLVVSIIYTLAKTWAILKKEADKHKND